MYCWICGREIDGNYHYIPIRDRSFPVCADDRTCGQLGNYRRLNEAEDEQLLSALLEKNQPIPKRLKNSILLFNLRNKQHSHS